MPLSELEGRLAAGSLRVAVDTNVIGYADNKGLGGWRTFSDLCDLASRVNAARHEHRRVEFLISSLVHHEVLRQLREHFGAAFDPEVILAGLRAKRVLEVVDFTVADAERLAARVNARFPSRDEWAGHKKQRACACLGLKDDVTSASGATCGATVDWLIGSHAERLDALMMTHDAGPEWTGVTRVSPKDVRRVLEAELARLS